MILRIFPSYFHHPIYYYYLILNIDFPDLSITELSIVVFEECHKNKYNSNNQAFVSMVDENVCRVFRDVIFFFNFVF